MKDIKSYVIGFLTCACLFLIMGQTKSDSQIGRYQISSTVHLNKAVFETIIDTETGDIFKREKVKFEQYVKVGKKNIFK